MTRFAILSALLAIAASGCGANYSSLGQLAPIAVATTAGVAYAAGARYHEPEQPGYDETGYPPDAYVCSIDAAVGGEEVRADSITQARARCEEIHGVRSDAQHCTCEPLAMLYGVTAGGESPGTNTRTSRR